MSVESVILVGEDAVCCALGQKLIDVCLGWPLVAPAIVKGGVTRLAKDIDRYRDAARRFPVVCIADVDGGCALAMRRQWCPAGTPPGFVLRLAVREAESWVMADALALAAFLRISARLIPERPDEETNPKQKLLGLARQSKVRRLPQEMVSGSDPNKPGLSYNDRLSDFVRDHWTPFEAARRSPSLARAVQRIEELKAGA